MGIFSRKSNDNTKVNNEEVRSSYITPDISLRYSSGINADVVFGDESNLGEKYQNKKVQNVNVVYTQTDGKFVAKSYIIEPLYGTGTDGTQINMTREYYAGLISQGRINDVKGFFKAEFANELEKTNGNYLGSLSYDQTGNAYRYYDEAFRQSYARDWQEEKSRRASEKSKSHFYQQLKENVVSENGIYQRLCDNEDERARGAQNLEGKSNVR